MIAPFPVVNKLTRVRSKLADRRPPALLAEHFVQPRAERCDVFTQTVDGDLGLIQFQRGLLAGGEKQVQRLKEFVVSGDVGSFLGVRASVESRSWIRA